MPNDNIEQFWALMKQADTARLEEDFATVHHLLTTDVDGYLKDDYLARWIHAVRGYTYFQENKLSKANRMFKVAVQKNTLGWPDSVVLFYACTTEPKQAAQALRRYFGNRNKGTIYYDWKILPEYSLDLDFDLAIERLDYLYEETQSGWAVFFRGLLYRRIDYWEQAVEDYRAATERLPEEPAIHNWALVGSQLMYDTLHRRIDRQAALIDGAEVIWMSNNRDGSVDEKIHQNYDGQTQTVKIPIGQFYNFERDVVAEGFVKIRGENAPEWSLTTYWRHPDLKPTQTSSS